MSKVFIQKVLNSLRSQQLSKDIAYTLVSFIVLAISGIVINVVVTVLRDAASLGVFNLSYAVYIIASQFAVFGVHYSVLRHAAYYNDSPTERGKLLFTASILSLLLGCLFAIIIYFAHPFYILLFKSELVAKAISFTAFGLILFPLNKVLLGYLNGIKSIKAFAILQGLRYLSVMITVSIIVASPLSIEYSTFGFLVAEIITATLSILFILTNKLVGPLVFDIVWMKKHFSFGAKGLMAGMFAEINSRLDVLMIGFFLTDHAVGIYSFAAMLVDGLYHVLAMVRINFNPLLVNIFRDQDWVQAKQLRAQSKKYLLPVTIALSFFLLAAFYIFTTMIMPSKGLQYGTISLMILLTGLIAISIYVPFDNLMMVSGHPGYQTLQQMAMVSANVIFAVLLLPHIGIEGAAIGTVCGYLTGIIMLITFTKRKVGWNLFNNTLSEVS